MIRRVRKREARQIICCWHASVMNLRENGTLDAQKDKEGNAMQAVYRQLTGCTVTCWRYECARAGKIGPESRAVTA